MEWEKERAIYGWLGKPPDVVLQGSRSLMHRWKRLNQRAASVVRLPMSGAGLEARRIIARERDALISQAFFEAEERRDGQRSDDEPQIPARREEVADG